MSACPRRCRAAAGGDGDDIELHVRELIGDFERVNEVWLARMTHLALVLEGREHVRPPEQLDVGHRAVDADFFEEILEANHKNRCLNCYRALLARHYI